MAELLFVIDTELELLKMRMHGILSAVRPKSAKKFRWTGKATDLVELLYALDTNYYSIANNCAHALNNFSYIMEYSMYKTFAGKYKCRTRKVNKKYRKNGRFIVKHMTKTGVKERFFYDGGFKRKKPTYKSECDIMPRTIYTAGRTSLVERLKARECELCGATDDLVMHHVRKLKNLQGKESWERHMIARKRKTIAVCRSCHKKIHDGKID